VRCPHCEARVPKGAAACPECGSDRRTGWASDETLDYEGVEIPDSYDPERWGEEAISRRAKRRGLKLVALVLAAFFALTALGGLGGFLRFIGLPLD